MSLFKHYHKIKVSDNFAFVGPAGEPPKPINDTEFSKAIHAPYAGKAWKIKKGTQTFIIQQYANPNKRGLWEIVNMDNMSRVMENAKLSEIKKYVFDNFGVKLVDEDTTKIKDMDYSTILANWGFAYNGKGPGKIEYWKFRENDDKEYMRAISNIRQVAPKLIMSSSNDGSRRITIMRDELVQSASKEALGKNIATEIKAGKDPKQAAAIAYNTQRENDKCSVNDGKRVEVYNQYQSTKPTKASVRKLVEKVSGAKVVSEQQMNNYNQDNPAFHYKMSNGDIYDARVEHMQVHIYKTSFGDSATIKDDLGYKPDICGCMDFTDIENIVHTTIQYIKAKYPNEQNTMEKWLSLIGEEFGELCQAINDGDVNNVIEEGTQTIAAIYLMLSDFVINANVLASAIKDATYDPAKMAIMAEQKIREGAKSFQKDIDAGRVKTADQLEQLIRRKFRTMLEEWKHFPNTRNKLEAVIKEVSQAMIK